MSQFKIINSPIGPLTLEASSHGLRQLSWGKSPRAFHTQVMTLVCEKAQSILARAELQLNEYFSGTRFAFDLPLEPTGTEFQKQVWQQLLKIPYGKHISYGEQARRLGRLSAARAVGGANGKNPIGIIIPCHRVIGASGALMGFAGGVEVKRQLLALEGIIVSK